MKKLSWILLFVLCAAVTFPAQAQFNMAIGGITGLNFSIHGGSDLQSTGTGLGFAFGAQADMSFTKSIGLVTTLYFDDGRGGSYNFTTQGVTANYDSSVGYFMIEPLFKYTLPSAPVYIIGGPAIGFAVQGSYAVTATGYQGSKGSISDMNARFEIKAGSGYIIPLSRDMRINTQFTFGFGPTTAQLQLGALSKAGRGAPADLMEAYRWYYTAAASGDPEARRALAALAQRMPPGQIGEAGSRVRLTRSPPEADSSAPVR